MKTFVLTLAPLLFCIACGAQPLVIHHVSAHRPTTDSCRVLLTDRPEIGEFQSVESAYAYSEGHLGFLFNTASGAQEAFPNRFTAYGTCSVPEGFEESASIE